MRSHSTAVVSMLTVLIVCWIADLSMAQSAQTQGTAIGIGAGGQVHAFVFDPDNENTAYAGGDVCGVYKLTYDKNDVNASSWSPWSAGLGFNDLNMSYYVDDLLVLGDDSGVDLQNRGVYAATWGGIYFRRQNDLSWRCLTTDRVYTGGYADRSLDNSGAHADTLRIPFSCLAFDDSTKTLYAGAGHGRTIDDSYPARRRSYYDFYPTTDADTSTTIPHGQAGEFSVWACDLSNGQIFNAVAGTEHGKVRQVAVANYKINGVPKNEVLYACDDGVRIVGEAEPLWTPELATKGDPPALPGRQQKFDSSGSSVYAARASSRQSGGRCGIGGRTSGYTRRFSVADDT